MQFVDYLVEKNGGAVILTEHAFLAYKVIENSKLGVEFYVSDFFIEPEHRVRGPFEEIMGLALRAAEANEAKVMTCHVEIAHPRCSELVRARLRWGFKIYAADGEKIALLKRLGK